MTHPKRTCSRVMLLATTAVLLTLTGPLCPARAALVAYSDPTFGPASAVLDTSTGLEWLSLRVTLGRSPAQVLTQLAPGGAFAGFRYATRAEFDGLTASYFGADGICCYKPLDLARTESFADLFGPTASSASPFGLGLPTLSGFYDPSFGPDADSSLITRGSFFYQSYDAPGGAASLAGAYDQDRGYTLATAGSGRSGSFLVRQAEGAVSASLSLPRAPGVAVAEPASLALAGAGLGLLALTRLRRRGGGRRLGHPPSPAPT